MCRRPGRSPLREKSVPYGVAGRSPALRNLQSLGALGPWHYLSALIPKPELAGRRGLRRLQAGASLEQADKHCLFLRADSGAFSTISIANLKTPQILNCQFSTGGCAQEKGPADCRPHSPRVGTDAWSYSASLVISSSMDCTLFFKSVMSFLTHSISYLRPLTSSMREPMPESSRQRM